MWTIQKMASGKWRVVRRVGRKRVSRTFASHLEAKRYMQFHQALETKFERVYGGI